MNHLSHSVTYTALYKEEIMCCVVGCDFMSVLNVSLQYGFYTLYGSLVCPVSLRWTVDGATVCLNYAAVLFSKVHYKAAAHHSAPHWAAPRHKWMREALIVSELIW